MEQTIAGYYVGKARINPNAPSLTYHQIAVKFGTSLLAAGGLMIIANRGENDT